MSSDLIEELDQAAKAILEASNLGAAAAIEGDEPVSLADRIKAFDSVVKYAQLRHGLRQPEAKTTQGSKFDDIRSQFHGEVGVRRSAPRKAKTKASNGVTALASDVADALGAFGTDGEADPADPASTH